MDYSEEEANTYYENYLRTRHYHERLHHAWRYYSNPHRVRIHPEKTCIRCSAVIMSRKTYCDECRSVRQKEISAKSQAKKKAGRPACVSCGGPRAKGARKFCGPCAKESKRQATNAGMRAYYRRKRQPNPCHKHPGTPHTKGDCDACRHEDRADKKSNTPLNQWLDTPNIKYYTQEE